MSDCEGPEITANGAGAKQTMSDEITLKSERPNTEPTAKMGNGMDPKGDGKRTYTLGLSLNRTQNPNPNPLTLIP